MHIVLVGCGRVGASLATSLAADGHNVVIVDKDPSTFANLGSAFNGVTVTGTGIDIEVLRRAGIEHADAFVAVTSLDNVNIMASQIVKQIMGVPKVIARINDPRKWDAYAEFEVETICPTDLGASRLRLMLDVQGFQILHSLGAGEVVLGRMTVTEQLPQKTVGDLERLGKLRVCAVERDDGAELPTLHLPLQVGDRLLIAIRRDAMRNVPGLLPKEERR